MQISSVRAIITGGASGLGAATVKRIIAHGGRVAVFDLPTSHGAALAKELGGHCIFHPTDVTSEAEVGKSTSIDRF